MTFCISRTVASGPRPPRMPTWRGGRWASPMACFASGPAFVQDGIIAEERCRTAGVEEDDPLALLEAPLAAVVDQPGGCFARIDRVEQNCLQLREHADCFQGIGAGHAVAGAHVIAVGHDILAGYDVRAAELVRS